MKDHKEFFQYVIPSMLAFALSGVYSIADGFFVGNAMGDSALAAINVAYPLTAFLQAIGTGIGMGGAVEYSIAMGSQPVPVPDFTNGKWIKREPIVRGKYCLDDICEECFRKY